MSRRDNRVERERDGGWGWMVVMGAFLVNFTILGLLRSGGVIYVALVEYFGISRKEASWPFTISGALMFISGPIAAFLSNYFSIRQIVISGVSIASLGVIFSYFATNIITVIVLYGIVQGLGIGLMFTLNPVILNQYFTRRRATAMGIAYAGASLGSFAIPPATEILLDYYGVHGCFLILGGVSLNAIVGASFYRAPKFTDKLEALNPRGTKDGDQIEVRKKSIVSMDVIIVCNNKIVNEDATKEESSLMIENNEINGKELQQSKSTELNEKFIRRMSVDIRHGMTKYAKLILETISHPLFAILCLTMTSYFLSSYTYLMVIVDYAVDRGITDTDSVYLVSIYSITDLFGRLTIGWFSDSSKISRRHVVLFASIGLGITMEMLVFTWSYMWMAGASAMLGLFSGCLLINYPPLMAEILGIDKLATAIGFAGLMIGCVNFTRPFLIGYFRDTFGVYDNMFHSFASIHFFCSLLWILHPITQYYFNKRTKKIISDNKMEIKF